MFKIVGERTLEENPSNQLRQGTFKESSLDELVELAKKQLVELIIQSLRANTIDVEKISATSRRFPGLPSYEG